VFPVQTKSTFFGAAIAAQHACSTCHRQTAIHPRIISASATITELETENLKLKSLPPTLPP
jgi:hypothetical protein